MKAINRVPLKTNIIAIFATWLLALKLGHEMNISNKPKYFATHRIVC